MERKCPPPYAGKLVLDELRDALVEVVGVHLIEHTAQLGVAAYVLEAVDGAEILPLEDSLGIEVQQRGELQVKQGEARLADIGQRLADHPVAGIRNRRKGVIILAE